MHKVVPVPAITTSFRTIPVELRKYKKYIAMHKGEDVQLFFSQVLGFACGRSKNSCTSSFLRPAGAVVLLLSLPDSLI